MAYYDALTAAWNSITQPPSGVTGVGLSSSMTTSQKLTAINAWTVTGSVPTSFTVSGSDIANCINWTEFATLASSQQTNLLLLCAIPQLLGGSANTSHLAPGMILANFNVAGATVSNLTALAKAVIQPWWQSVGYPVPIRNTDLTAAGLS